MRKEAGPLPKPLSLFCDISSFLEPFRSWACPSPPEVTATASLLRQLVREAEDRPGGTKICYVDLALTVGTLSYRYRAAVAERALNWIGLRKTMDIVPEPEPAVFANHILGDDDPPTTVVAIGYGRSGLAVALLWLSAQREEDLGRPRSWYPAEFFAQYLPNALTVLYSAELGADGNDGSERYGVEVSRFLDRLLG